MNIWFCGTQDFQNSFKAMNESDLQVLLWLLHELTNPSGDFLRPNTSSPNCMCSCSGVHTWPWSDTPGSSGQVRRSSFSVTPEGVRSRPAWGRLPIFLWEPAPAGSSVLAHVATACRAVSAALQPVHNVLQMSAVAAALTPHEQPLHHMVAHGADAGTLMAPEGQPHSTSENTFHSKTFIFWYADGLGSRLQHRIPQWFHKNNSF